jgi:hypothetical protein
LPHSRRPSNLHPPLQNPGRIPIDKGGTSVILYDKTAVQSASQCGMLLKVANLDLTKFSNYFCWLAISMT